MKQNERIAAVEQIASSAHKRLDGYDTEIKSLRDSKHDHSNVIQKHSGILSNHSEVFESMKELIKGLTEATRDNTNAIFSFKIMAMTAISMGGTFITFCGFIGGKILGWW